MKTTNTAMAKYLLVMFTK